MIAALFVETGGAYFGQAGIDPWDEARDARNYPGAYPVVAHPPCTRWCMAGASAGLQDGNDGGCFEAALAAVRTFGGVLEHPAYTLAWRAFGLARPQFQGWTRNLFDDGWTCHIDQWHYGAPFRKPTWLYYVGETEPPPLVWGKPPRHVPGFRAVTSGGPGSKGKRQRSRTPDAMREVLLGMARHATTRAIA